MNFDFSEDQKLLQKTARDFLAEHSPLQVNRDVLESGKDWSPELWKGDRGDGLAGRGDPRGVRRGRLRLPRARADRHRRSAARSRRSRSAPSVYLATEAILLAGSDAQKKKWLTALASGEAVGTLALAEGPGFPSPAQPDDELRGRQALRQEDRRARRATSRPSRSSPRRRRRASPSRSSTWRPAGVDAHADRVDRPDAARVRELAFDGAPAERARRRGHAAASCSRSCSTAPRCCWPSSSSAAPSARSR